MLTPGFPTAALAARRQLQAVLRAGAATPEARALGLAPDAAAALGWVRWPLRHSPGQPLFTLGFDDSCGVLPASVHVAGCRLPVRSVRSGGDGLAQTWLRGENATHTYLDGTLGAILRPLDSPSRLFALTAGHVVGGAPGSGRGDLVRFAFQSEALPPIMGQLLDWAPRFDALPVDTAIDAGIAEISPAALEGLARRPREWPTGVADVLGDDVLRLRTRGVEIAGDSPEWMHIRLRLGNDSSRSYRVINALCWRTAAPTARGDSGGAIWNARDELVAIHAGAAPAGSDRNAVAIAIRPILEWCGCAVVRRGEPLTRPAVPRNLTPPDLPVPAGLPADATEADVLARTMWGEARGEPDPGMAAVAHVVLNRAAAQRWWGRAVIDVCKKPWQFSCWNAGPSRQKLLEVSASNRQFAHATGLAAQLLAMQPQERARIDPTAGATHYYARALTQPPAWARGRTPCARIGGHDFFKDIA